MVYLATLMTMILPKKRHRVIAFTQIQKYLLSCFPNFPEGKTLQHPGGQFPKNNKLYPKSVEVQHRAPAEKVSEDPIKV